MEDFLELEESGTLLEIGTYEGEDEFSAEQRTALTVVLASCRQTVAAPIRKRVSVWGWGGGPVDGSSTQKV